MGSKVLAFLDEALKRKRPAPQEGPGGKRQQLLPLYLHLESGHREAKEQLLWKLGDSSAVPATVARAFTQQHVQQPQQLEREAQRLQRELERQLEQHKDLPSAPRSPTIVKLEVRVTLPHLGALFYDDCLWDLGAPRAACEAYVAQLCNELRLDWQAHTLITRKMKDQIDAAARDFAAGKAQAFSLPRGRSILRAPPSRLPTVVRMTEAQKQQLREHLEAAMAAKQRGEQVKSPRVQALPPELAKQQAAQVQSPGQAAQGQQEEAQGPARGHGEARQQRQEAQQLPGQGQQAQEQEQGQTAGQQQGQGQELAVGQHLHQQVPAEVKMELAAEVKVEQAAGVKMDVAAAAAAMAAVSAAAPAAAAGDVMGGQAASEQTSGQDMPDLP